MNTTITMRTMDTTMGIVTKVAGIMDMGMGIVTEVADIMTMDMAIIMGRWAI
jgi:hypothetical protein